MKKQQADEKTVGVDLTGAIRKRLRLYVAAHEGLTKKAVVNAALDEYLKKRGA